MRCFWILALLVATTGFMVGCDNGDSKPSPNNEGNGTQGTVDPQEEDGQASNATPEEVAHAFLEAARTNNKEQVAAMLTPVARAEAARTGDVVGAVASDIIRFELGKTHQTNPKAAGVESRLVRRTGPNATPQPLEVVWAVRLTEEGWRVNGVILPISDEESLFLNFEKPDEIIKQHEAMAAQKKGGSEQKDKTLLR